jgi:hypothetical protein
VYPSDSAQLPVFIAQLCGLETDPVCCLFLLSGDCLGSDRLHIFRNFSISSDFQIGDLSLSKVRERDPEWLNAPGARNGRALPFHSFWCAAFRCWSLRPGRGEYRHCCRCVTLSVDGHGDESSTLLSQLPNLLGLQVGS